MNNFIRIEIETPSVEQAEILIANLSEIKFYAFEQEGNDVIAYILETDFDEKKLEETAGLSTHFKKQVIRDENWNLQWESELQPVIINNFAAIRADFHKPIQHVKHELIITPKMSFGTGHHPTTFLMIELMAEVDFIGKTVLDFGTGTGVLAILAEKCGAASVMAIDYDTWSINNAIENVKANGCTHIAIEQKDSLSGIPPVDIITANINLNVLTQSSDSISELLKTGSLLLASGFLSANEIEMEKTFSEKGFVKKMVLKKDDWLAILFAKI